MKLRVLSEGYKILIVFKNSVVKVLKDNLVYLPTPSISLTGFWNFGSLLGVCLATQIITGIFLVFKLKVGRDTSFTAILLLRDISYIVEPRFLHANGASIFFICLYLHIGRGLYSGSFAKKHTWLVGVSILLLTIATAFLGYVLPWGQMSFWGASVIIGLLSALPLVGSSAAIWLWGSFSVTDGTLSRFLAFHFLLPFVLCGLMFFHITLLHIDGSSNPTFPRGVVEKIYFSKTYGVNKDGVGALLILIALSWVRLIYPTALGDVENFVLADKGTTPLHIIPEWYYLFAYAILRAIPRKLGGVLALVLRVTILYLLPLTTPGLKRANFSPLKKRLFWGLVVVFFALTWVGARPVESPYIETGALLTCIYFGLFLLVSKFGRKRV